MRRQQQGLRANVNTSNTVVVQCFQQQHVSIEEMKDPSSRRGQSLSGAVSLQEQSAMVPNMEETLPPTSPPPLAVGITGFDPDAPPAQSRLLRMPNGSTALDLILQMYPEVGNIITDVEIAFSSFQVHVANGDGTRNSGFPPLFPPKGWELSLENQRLAEEQQREQQLLLLSGTDGTGGTPSFTLPDSQQHRHQQQQQLIISVSAGSGGTNSRATSPQGQGQMRSGSILSATSSQQEVRSGGNSPSQGLVGPMSLIRPIKSLPGVKFPFMVVVSNCLVANAAKDIAIAKKLTGTQIMRGGVVGPALDLNLLSASTENGDEVDKEEEETAISAAAKRNKLKAKSSGASSPSRPREAGPEAEESPKQGGTDTGSESTFFLASGDTEPNAKKPAVANVIARTASERRMLRQQRAAEKQRLEVLTLKREQAIKDKEDRRNQDANVSRGRCSAYEGERQKKQLELLREDLNKNAVKQEKQSVVLCHKAERNKANQAALEAAKNEFNQSAMDARSRIIEQRSDASVLYRAAKKEELTSRSATPQTGIDGESFVPRILSIDNGPLSPGVLPASLVTGLGVEGGGGSDYGSTVVSFRSRQGPGPAKAPHHAASDVMLLSSNMEGHPLKLQMLLTELDEVTAKELAVTETLNQKELDRKRTADVEAGYRAVMAHGVEKRRKLTSQLRKTVAEQEISAVRAERAITDAKVEVEKRKELQELQRIQEYHARKEKLAAQAAEITLQRQGYEDAMKRQLKALEESRFEAPKEEDTWELTTVPAYPSA